MDAISKGKNSHENHAEGECLNGLSIKTPLAEKMSIQHLRTPTRIYNSNRIPSLKTCKLPNFHNVAITVFT